MINAARISRLPPLVENALDELLANVVFTPEQKKQVIEVKIRMLLEAIIKVVKGDDKIADKLAALLGPEAVGQEITHFTIHRYLKRHFPPSKKSIAIDAAAANIAASASTVV
jgi:hypothetical protein